jgi:hypothetical protein
VRVRRQSRRAEPPAEEETQAHPAPTPTPPDAPSTPAAQEAAAASAQEPETRGDRSQRREVTLPRYRRAAEPTARHAPPITPAPRRRAASGILLGVVAVALIAALLVLFLLVRGS